MFSSKLLLSITFIIIVNSCSSDNISKIKKINDNTDNGIYSSIYNEIKYKNIDEADNLYIKLKTNFETSKYIKSAAETLAIVHMQNNENILANFYLQEALESDSSDQFAKFLLAKNQFLSANKNERDLNYIQRALEALKIDKDLVYGDYAILANSMLIRVKLDMAWKNSQIGNLYKRLNKKDAVNIYKQKIEQLGVNIDDIEKK